MSRQYRRQQAAEKDPYASLPLNRLAPTYCQYASARRFSRASPLDLFEQPARGFNTLLEVLMIGLYAPKELDGSED